MATIDLTHYRDLKDADTDELLGAPGYTAISNDPDIAYIGVGANSTSIAVAGSAFGDFSVTVTRVSDGATGTVSGSVGIMDGAFNVVFGDAHLNG